MSAKLVNNIDILEHMPENLARIVRKLVKSFKKTYCLSPQLVKPDGVENCMCLSCGSEWEEGTDEIHKTCCAWIELLKYLNLCETEEFEKEITITYLKVTQNNIEND